MQGVLRYLSHRPIRALARAQGPRVAPTRLVTVHACSTSPAENGVPQLEVLVEDRNPLSTYSHLEALMAETRTIAKLIRFRPHRSALARSPQ